MNRMGATVAMSWLAGMAAFTPPVSAQAPAGASARTQVVETPAVQVEVGDRVHWGYPVVRIGQGYTLKAGDAARNVTVIFGDATIEGRVDRDVVVVLGSAQLTSTAVIDGSLVVVGGHVQAAQGAQVHEDLFVGGGGLDAPAGFSPGGHYVGIGSTALDASFRNIAPWLTRGLLWGRPIVPGLSWVWTIALAFFLMNLLLGVVFDAPVKAASVTLRATPLSAFMSGLLVMLLAGPVCLLLAVSVIGLAVVPFVMCALLIATVLGKIAFARWIGMSVVHQDDLDNRSLSMRSFLIGSAIMCVAYMIPVVGFVTWAMAGVFGLRAATQAFFSAYRRDPPPGPARADRGRGRRLPGRGPPRIDRPLLAVGLRPRVPVDPQGSRSAGVARSGRGDLRREGPARLAAVAASATEPTDLCHGRHASHGSLQPRIARVTLISSHLENVGHDPTVGDISAPRSHSLGSPCDISESDGPEDDAERILRLPTK